MRGTPKLIAGLLAFAVPMTGCASSHFNGEYNVGAPRSEIRSTHEPMTLASGSEWLFFWGLVDTGRFDVDRELRHHVRPNEVVTDLEVTEHLSVGGALLWIVTAGLASHHTVVAKGAISEIRKPEPPTVTKEKETIITPSAPPAGYEKEKIEREKSPEKPSTEKTAPEKEKNP